LAVLRANWQKKGDLLIVDHRGRVPSTCFALVGRGCAWLGKDWRLTRRPGPISQPRPTLWVSNSVADLAEWTFRSDGLRITRTALLFRGRSLALLGDQVEGKAIASEPLEVQFGMAPAMRAEEIAGCRGLLLCGLTKGLKAQVLPIALPAMPYETERGRFQVATADHEPTLTLRMATQGRRCWLPLLLSWDPVRHRKRLHWRVLTVAEQSKSCPADVAFAVRVSWGRNETYVIYRSLARPALRSFLGFQTRARFLFGQFNGEGIVEPLVSVD
jgi:hypothetical protein